MKVKIKALFLFLPVLVSAQQNYKVIEKLNWTKSEKFQEKELDTPLGSFANAHRYSKDPRIPVIRKEYDITSGQECVVSLSPIEIDTLRPNPKSNPEPNPVLSNEFETKIEYYQERGQKKAILTLIPVRQNINGAYERLKHYSLSVQILETSPTILAAMPENTRNSVLEKGIIHKIAVDKPGIYKIDKAYLEKNLKISASSINPNNIHIYGNGGTKLPEANSAKREDDLAENHIFVSGAEDGVFNDQDYLLFYATGPDLLSYDESTGDFSMTKNPYSFKSYYFIKIDNNPGLRVQKSNYIENGDYQSNSGQLCIHYQKELYNLLELGDCTHGTGQMWFGEDLSNSRTLDLGNTFSFPNIVKDRKAKLKISFASRSNRSTQLKTDVGTQSFTKFLGTINYSCTSTYAALNSINEEFDPEEEIVKLKLTFPDNGSNSNGWLDFVQVTAWRKYIWNYEPMFVFDPLSSTFPSTSYTIENGGLPGMLAWDISDPLRPREIPTRTSANSLIFTDQSSSVKKSYLVFQQTSNYPSPEYSGTVANQNIHGLDGLDFVIVYPEIFKSEAEKLLNHRSSFSKLSGAMVSIDQVYHEFGSGSKDPTALRDFVKMLYNRNPSFKYLILIGNSSYDYRHINNRVSDQNLVPTFQTSESLNPIDGFPTDDYYALLDNNEGQNLSGLLDIFVGRILARTKDEASRQVDKIIKYDTDAGTMEDWRLKLLFIGDDEDSNIHMSDINRVSDDFAAQDPLYNHEKVYLDAFEQVTTPGGERYPEVNKAINASVFAGNLIVTYLGHGGPTGLAQERVLQIPDINTWDNQEKLFLMITATCTFTTFDDPKITSAGQQTTLLRGGTVALYSTVRPVYANDNYQLTNSVFRFVREKSNGKYYTLGEILAKSKNANSGGGFTANARKFLLFGDPSQTLAYPVNEVVLDSVNGKPIGQNADTLKALSSVTLKGKVINSNKDKITDFNGILYATIFDKAIDLKTRANDGGSRVQNFKVQKNIVFKGNAEVKNGEWEFTFIVPKDINYSFGQGKLSLYASDLKQTDAAGFDNSLVIGGVSSQQIGQDNPPVVSLYMNNDQFVSGGITDNNPKIFAKLTDDMGINITGNSIGHDLVAVLDRDSDNPIILNNFFKSRLNDFKEGEVLYPLKNLSPGKHTLSLTAWDITNNMGTAEIEFTVVDGGNIILDRVFNYPNPFNLNTHFQFETNISGLPVNLTIPIYSISGKLVRKIEKQIDLTGYRSAEIEWDGTDESGSQLPSGIYLYQIRISSNAGEPDLNLESRHQKLIILR